MHCRPTPESVMAETRPLVGIDVGSSAVSVVVAVPEGDKLALIGCGHRRHDGARKGIISNLAEVSEAVQVAAEEAEVMASIPVEQAAVGIGGTPIKGDRATGSVQVTGRDHTVTLSDQRRALDACSRYSIPSDFRVLEIIPCGYSLDGQGGVEQPNGMPGSRLDAFAYVLFTNTTHADTVVQAVNHASVAVRQLHYEPLAAAEAVLTRDERDLGCLLIDVGYATSEWILIAESVVLASGAVPAGGRHFTSDLAAMLKTTTAAAEQVKRDIGASMDRQGLEHQAVEVPALGGGGNQIHPALFASEVLHERARDLFIGVHRILVAERLDRVPRAGIVLTGGGACLDGMEEVAESIFGHRVRVGAPINLTGIVEPVSGPEWAVACGLVWLQHRRRQTVVAAHEDRSGVFAWLRNALGEFFEIGGGT